MYNMHRWGVMVTIVSGENKYKTKNDERDKLAEEFEKAWNIVAICPKM